MKITRRNFLGTGISVLATSVGFLSIPQIINGQINQKPSKLHSVLDKDVFMNLLGTQFNLSSETKGSIDVRLINVQDLCTNTSDTHKTEGFSLLFKADIQQEEVVQDIYTIYHKTLGSFSLLLVPVLQTEANPVVCYEAVINRLV